MTENSNTTTRKRPPVDRGQGFIVQCEGFRCMAYKDRTGKWRDYFDGDEITGPVEIVADT